MPRFGHAGSRRNRQKKSPSDGLLICRGPVDSRKPGRCPPARKEIARRAIASRTMGLCSDSSFQTARSRVIAGLTRRSHSRGRQARPELCSRHVPRNKRAQGKPGARCTRSLACEVNKAHERSRHRFTGFTRPSLRNGFNGFLRDLLGDRAFLPPSPAGYLPHA
jgi:hypothetical protein